MKLNILFFVILAMFLPFSVHASSALENFRANYEAATKPALLSDFDNYSSLYIVGTPKSTQVCELARVDDPDGLRDTEVFFIDYGTHDSSGEFHPAQTLILGDIKNWSGIDPLSIFDHLKLSSTPTDLILNIDKLPDVYEDQPTPLTIMFRKNNAKDFFFMSNSAGPVAFGECHH